MLRLILVALVASTLIGCAGREDSGLGYNFGVYVDRAELPNSSCQLDIGLNNNHHADYANFEYALNFFDSQGRWSAGPIVQGDYIPSGGMSKSDYIVPVSCDRLVTAKVARELCLDIVGWPGKRDCYDIDKIVINEAVAMAETPAAPVLGPPPDVVAPQGKPRFYTVFFGWDRDDINPVAQLVIDSIVEDWRGAPEALQLVGHADRSGAADYNQRLSERRVQSVTKGLLSQGIEADRVTGAGRGESDPLVPTPDGVREPQNRRVVVTIEVR